MTSVLSSVLIATPSLSPASATSVSPTPLPLPPLPQSLRCDRCKKTIYSEFAAVTTFILGLRLNYCSMVCSEAAYRRLNTPKKRARVVRDMCVQERVRANPLMTMILTMGASGADSAGSSTTSEYGDLVDQISAFLTFRQRTTWREVCGNFFSAPSPEALRMHALFATERAVSKRLRAENHLLRNRVSRLKEEKSSMYSQTEVDAVQRDIKAEIKADVLSVVEDTCNTREGCVEDAIEDFRREVISDITDCI